MIRVEPRRIFLLLALMLVAQYSVFGHVLSHLGGAGHAPAQIQADAGRSGDPLSHRDSPSSREDACLVCISLAAATGAAFSASPFRFASIPGDECWCLTTQTGHDPALVRFFQARALPFSV